MFRELKISNNFLGEGRGQTSETPELVRFLKNEYIPAHIQGESPPPSQSNVNLCTSLTIQWAYIVLQVTRLLYNLFTEDISVVFFEEQANNGVEQANNREVWQALLQSNQIRVFKHVAIIFRTPEYINLKVTDLYLTNINMIYPSPYLTSSEAS